MRRLNLRICLLVLLSLVLSACQPETLEKPVTRIVEMPVEVQVTRVVEKPVEVVVTRVVEKPVEVVVTHVVEKPVEVVVTRLIENAGETVVTPPPESVNVARFASARVSSGIHLASAAIDGDPETSWSAGGHPSQWIEVRFDQFHLVDRIEMVVAQSPAGETSHQVWVGDGSGASTKLHEYTDIPTADGQTLSLPIDPPLVLDRVSILTTKSPSWVAWREVRVFGVSTLQPQFAGPPQDWPQINPRGDLELPVQITNAGDGSGRLFVVEQKGRIRIISNGNLLPIPFLDISDQVSCCVEQGLLSVAFPPDYDEKQHFYVNYTNSEGDTEIVRYRLSSEPNVADPESAELILRIDQPHKVHNGGHMAFGPKDGYLYIGTGDGGAQGDPENLAQEPSTLLGKMLRIDVESGVSPYAIPESNPFTETAGYRAEIWALGLRNPWGFAFDKQTGDLYIADVGYIEFEEVNYQPALSKGGENYGWAILEGIHCHLALYEPTALCYAEGLTQPVAEYPHTQGCAIIGGPVYRGAKFIPMQGIYFYADFCSGRIWGLRQIGDKWETALLYEAPFQITAIGEDEDGNLYVTNYNEGFVLALEGEIHVPTATPVEEGGVQTQERPNVALFGSVRASSGVRSASHAIDGDPETSWESRLYPVQWLEVTFDRFYLVDRIEMIVAQSPAGETSHEIWIGEASGTSTKLHEYVDMPTSEGQSLSLPVDPPLVLNRVSILTTKSPSWVSWREVRVFGSLTTQPQFKGPPLDWPQINLRGDLELPVQITNAGDGSGRLFVVEQRGRIRVISDGALLPTPFLDISGQVSCCHEQGLLSVAFPPDYAKNGHFYVNYTDSEGDTVIARYRLTSDSNVADSRRAEIILRIDQPNAIHNGGHMAFGPIDGYLYIGTGDGGPAGDPQSRAQDPGTLLGKILRIDVESGFSPYAIPADNPYAKAPSYRGEIWALGLRNPSGFTFDQQTGDLYIGDMGEGELEEVNYQSASSTGGENYGWPFCEGALCNNPTPHISTGLIQPIAEYSKGCKTSGDFAYRGAQFAQTLGILLYADFCSGRIWGLKRVQDTWQSVLLHDAPFQIAAIGEGEDGSIYITNYDLGLIFSVQERVEQLDPTPTRTAAATLTPTETPVSLAAQGRVLFVDRGCVACHVVSSVPEAVGTSGPALDGYGDPSKWPLIAGVLGNTPENTKRWILDPVRFKPDTAMVNIGLSDEDADAIVAFLETLK